MFNMINALYHDKLWIFIRATFWEKLVPDHRAVSEVDSCRLMVPMQNIGSRAMKVSIESAYRISKLDLASFTTP